MYKKREFASCIFILSELRIITTKIFVFIFFNFLLCRCFTYMHIIEFKLNCEINEKSFISKGFLHKKIYGENKYEVKVFESCVLENVKRSYCKITSVFVYHTYFTPKL